MKIETKFNVGDTFVAIKDGKATEMVVGSIHMYVSGTASVDGITYTAKTQKYESSNIFKEKECFKSKEELIKSL